MGQGINAGDAMYGMAFERLLCPGPLPTRRLAAGRVLAGSVRRVIEGQCLDLAQEARPGTGPAAYLRMARAKTGALLAASLQMGAIMGGACRAVAERMRRAGELLGLAFQVRDDWLGIWGDPTLTGKSRDRDLHRRKVTYPVVAGYAAMTPPERRSFRATFAADGQGRTGAVAELRALLERRGADQVSVTACREFAEHAIHLVAACGFDGRHTRQFKELARYVANRNG
jgi:geranylgeranyl diphosphate synthase type I